MTETVSKSGPPRSGSHQQEAHHINFNLVYAAINRWERQHSNATSLPAS